MIKSKGYLNYYTALAIVIVATIAVTAQSLFLGPKFFGVEPTSYTHYNNYVIFKNSFYHLIDNLNLYTSYRAEQWDLYKYSPTFSLFMGVYAYLPDWLGLLLWNLLNSLVLFSALWNCKSIDSNNKFWVVIFVLVELIISLQNSQSNALVAGLIIMAFNLLEAKRTFWAVCLIMLSVYIKIFGIVAFVLILFYPTRWRAMLYGLFWFVLLALLPSLVTGMSELTIQYENWGEMLLKDHDTSLGISVAGILQNVFSVQNAKLMILLVSTALFIIPALNIRHYRNDKFRLMYLASVLLWVVIFNHKAESPTFIIAMAGIAIWYFSTLNSPALIHKILLFLAILLTSLSTMDIFPLAFRQAYVEPYVVKAWPSIAIWLFLLIAQYKLFFDRKRIDS